MKKIVLLSTMLLNLNVLVQAQEKSFEELAVLFEQKNYFKLKERYTLNKKGYSKTQQKFIEAILDNAFNKLKESNNKIDQLTKTRTGLNDFLLLKLYQIKEDNAIKLFNYKEAKIALETILRNYKRLLSENKIKETTNSLKIWTALEDAPKQRVHIKETNRLTITKDIAGLNNLKVHHKKDTVDFIFDTGANLSTVPYTTAKKLNMKIISVDVEVGTATGEKAPAQIAICPAFTLGSIEIQNAIFLVFKDSSLFFPQINFQIHGILGFPVIAALREIQITRDGYFIVPKKETSVNSASNMAMDGLTPLINIEGKHYTFDTGADNTMLYSNYYTENKIRIDEKYEPTKVHFAGAAGKKVFDGYIITQDFKISDKKVTLSNIDLLKEKIKDDETVYGNIGQDLIKQFSKMTLNFDKMFIKFN
ncbi:MAG: retropepsin-like aspartic protease [Niabella sp.]